MYKYLPILFLLLACEQIDLPKKKAYFAHQFTIPNYQSIKSDCFYSFDFNMNSKINFDFNCNAKIEYKELKAQLFISNIKMNDNLDLIKDILQEIT